MGKFIIGAERIYHYLSRMFLSACHTGSAMFYKLCCEFMAQKEELTAGDLVWGRQMCSVSVAQMQARALGAVVRMYAAAGVILLTALEQFLWFSPEITDCTQKSN